MRVDRGNGDRKLKPPAGIEPLIGHDGYFEIHEVVWVRKSDRNCVRMVEIQLANICPVHREMHDPTTRLSY